MTFIAIFVPLNRNLLHYPLARSLKAHLATRHRVRLTMSPYVMIVVHREGTARRSGKRKAIVWLRVPAAPLQTRPDMARAPTRFDIDVLLRLVAMSVMGKGKVIHNGAFAAGGRAITRTSKKRRHKKLFYSHDDRHRDERAETFSLAQREGYMQAVDAASGKPSRHAEKAAGKAAYKEASQRLRRTIPGDPHLTFASRRQLLSALGRATNKPANYRSVEDSLAYLSSLELVFARWYVDGSGDDVRHERRTIRLLDSVTYNADGTVAISVNTDFLSTTKSYFAKIPLPVPLSSEAALNLELWLHAFRPFDLEHNVQRQFQDFCEKLGLPATAPARAAAALDRALEQVNRHRTQRGERQTIAVREVPNSDAIAFRSIRRTKPKDDDDSHIP